MISQKMQLKIFLWMATFDIFSIWLLMFAYITRIDFMFLVNVNFVVMFVFLSFCFLLSSRLGFLSSLFVVVFIISIIKLYWAFLFTTDLTVKHFFSYMLGVLMPLVTLSFAKSFSSSRGFDFHREIMKFSRRYAYIAVSGIIVYSLLYFSGKISYFGLGTNLHYVLPFLMSGAKSSLFFLLIILISGKRSVLLNFFAQISVFYSRLILRRPLNLMFVLTVLIMLLFYVYENTPLLDRFKVYFAFDITDPDFYMLAFGGRFEELEGIYNYFLSHPNQIWFGAPPGAYYQWVVEFADYEASKNYAHVTIFGYIFRYGVFFSLLLYLTFSYYLIKRWNPANPYFLVFVGILTSSLFGANLVIDPTSWFFIGLVVTPPQNEWTERKKNIRDLELNRMLT